MKRLAYLLATVLAMAAAPDMLWSQDGYFGKNKVNYKHFSWRQLETEHFNVYYYQGADSLARIAARIAERACDKLTKDFNHVLSGKVPLVVYISHNDFEQTNITSEIIEESVGGFTTVFKNRVVVPYTGSFADLDHVISHEMVHAFMFDLFFGRSLESILSRQSLGQLPLWFAEGLAEYESRGWDPETEMIIKDLAINQRLIPVTELDNYGGSYLVYKEGQAILRYIAERYGQQKVSEMLHMVKANRSMDRTCKALLGLSLEKFSEEWVRSVQRQYWPALGGKKELPNVATQLTEHQRNESFFNLNPCFSPQGDKIAYISDQGGYAGIYIISSIDGHRIKHLVKGERTSTFEALHLAWYRGGLSWSPQGQWLVFAAKSSTGDRLYVVDAERGRIVAKHTFGLDGIYFPSWSPTDNRIVFCGLKDGKSDLYITHAFEGGLERLVDDSYDDRHPCWSPDGRTILFSSDRPAATDSAATTTVSFGRYRLFTISDGGGEVACATPDEMAASDPSWSTAGIAYISNFRGVPNVFYKSQSESAAVLMTDLLTGCIQPKWSRDGSKLTFIGYHQTGWNIYVVKNPLEKLPTVAVNEACPPASDDTLWQRPRIAAFGPADTTSIAEKPARPKFSVDWARGTIGYSTLSGVAGQAEIMVTDVLGNHLFYWQSDMVVNFENSNYQLTYYYLPKRLDYGISYYQANNYYLASKEDIVIEKVNGVQGIVSLPFNKYQRLDFIGSWNHYTQSYYYYTYPDASLDVVAPTVALVHDNALWGSTGPVMGKRWLAAVEASQKTWGSDLAFTTGYLDLRNYWRISRRYSFATRLLSGASFGPDAQHFYLGGPTSLRGYDYDAFYGTRMGLVNLELRIPFIDRLELAFPPIRIYGIRGVFFYDMGAAWTDDREFRGAQPTETALVQLDDLKASAGTGVRINLYPFLVKLDLAWNTDLARMDRNPRVSFSLGSEF